VATLKVPSLGDYIREQRESAQVSLRQLAKAAGVSNPYLSQIERGVKKPSAEILQQIAKGLRISAETLYVRAGILDERHGSSDVVHAVLSDPSIGDRHKRVLLDIYESFRAEHAAAPHAAAGPATQKASATTSAARKRAATKSTQKTTARKSTATRKAAARKTGTTSRRNSS
jgi:transcriptional regulator with XRE-family HTH domain